MADKYFLTLVHGTFAPEASWTREDSDSKFQKKLSERLGGDVVFERLEWSGKNSQKERIKAGQNIAEKLTRPDLSKQDRKHFIVCHSHGGNVALYAAANKQLEDNISGIICMNTPFLCALPRNFKPLLFALITVVFFTLSAIVEQLGSIIWIGDWQWYIKLLMFFLFVPFSILITIGLWMLFFGAFDILDKLGKKRDEMIDELSLPNTRIPIYSIWTGGDEISFAFNIVSGFGNLPFVLLYWPIVVISVVCLMIGVSLDWLPGLDVFNIEAQGWFSTYLTWIDNYLFDPLLTATAYFLVLVVSIAAIALVVNIMLCVFPYGLGMKHIPSPLWIRFFTSPVPIQARKTEFKCFDPVVFGLSHSVIYEFDQVIDAIAEWIQKEKV